MLMEKSDKVQSLDHLLCDQIYKPLMERVSLQLPPSQVVQIMTNLEHFERACKELQGELARARTSRSRTGSKILTATEKFAAGTKKAKDRIFELINSRIDDLLDNANYKWYVCSTKSRRQTNSMLTPLSSQVGYGTSKSAQRIHDGAHKVAQRHNDLCASWPAK